MRQPDHEQLKHSTLGITSFSLTMIGNFLLLVEAQFGLKYNTVSSIIGGLYWIVLILATVLAIIDLFKPDRKKTFPKLALLFGIVLLPIVLLIVYFSSSQYRW